MDLVFHGSRYKQGPAYLSGQLDICLFQRGFLSLL